LPSYRKRYRTEPAQDQRPEPTSQPPIVDDPVADAEQAAIKARMAELDSAERLAQQQRQQLRPQLPENVQRWIAAHSEYVTNRAKHFRLLSAHEEVTEEGISLTSPEYIETLERRLGISAANQSAPFAVSGVSIQPDALPRAVVVAGQAAPSPSKIQPVCDGGGDAAPVSAPVSRSVPSWSTGGPINSESNRLSVAELDIAMGLGLSPEEYLRQRQKMELLKVSKVLQQ
jgi:hypothetical protein